MEETVFKAELVEEKVIVWDKGLGSQLFESGWFGELLDDRLELALVEAMLLADRGKIEIRNKKKKMTSKEFYEHCIKIDNRFHMRYAVYKDLRERGLPVRTGFKFGCDFRVYERGVTPVKKGPKAPHEHTKWIVFTVAEDYACSFQELSRAVRLAHNIRANMLWAVVDNENDVTYYSITYLSP
ncbi:MAG: tRNA-intron lyase [Candidatus Aenigmatarchaeota archaeon]